MGHTSQFDPHGVCHPNFYLLQHSNNVCVVCLGSGHPLTREKDSHLICQVDHTGFTNGLTALLIEPLSKSKQGAQRLTPSSILCYLCCENGERFPVYSCIDGILIEINESIIKEPQLLVSRPLDEGHIAVIMPIFHERSKVCSNLLVKRERRKEFQPLEL